MANVSKKPLLILSDKEVEFLKNKSNSKTSPFREVQRAKALYLYYQKNAITVISSLTNLSRESIYKHLDKALNFGIEEALKDAEHSPKEPTITEQAKLWVVNLACTKPKDHGYASEVWSYESLAKHTRKYAPQEGYDCLNQAVKATIYRILSSNKVQPQKIKYYLERRDEQFEEKMNEVLLVYKEVNLQNEQKKDLNDLDILTVSIDEKPGVQAIKNIAPDLPPVAGKHSSIGRDYEYKRLGTLSILASLDLHSGKVIALVENQHRSIEFIKLLKKLDEYYPPNNKIRIILDNHSSHKSKETMKYLAERPNRFIYVFTPKHGSWLNLVETLFGKMSRTFLKQIRVASKDELKERILKGIEEINAEPVVHKWKEFAFSN
jgi:transposase